MNTSTQTDTPSIPPITLSHTTKRDCPARLRADDVPPLPGRLRTRAEGAAPAIAQLAARSDFVLAQLSEKAVEPRPDGDAGDPSAYTVGDWVGWNGGGGEVVGVGGTEVTP